MLYKSSSNSPSVQVIDQQIREGWGSRPVLILLIQGWVGVQNFGRPADVRLERSLTLYLPPYEQKEGLSFMTSCSLLFRDFCGLHFLKTSLC